MWQTQVLTSLVEVLFFRQRVFIFIGPVDFAHPFKEADEVFAVRGFIATLDFIFQRLLQRAVESSHVLKLSRHVVISFVVSGLFKELYEIRRERLCGRDGAKAVEVFIEFIDQSFS